VKSLQRQTPGHLKSILRVDDDEYEDDLDLSTLPDDELVEQMHDDLYNGLKEEVAEGTEILLERGWDANKVLNEALVAGMTIVGIDFRDGILFVPEVLMSANAMKAGMALLKPLLAPSKATSTTSVRISSA
jgi:5-methyltetrahydrofolate--homocysteine methyltransferase